MDEIASIAAFPEKRDGKSGTGKGKSDRVYLVRAELNQILNVYGRMVSAGQWKDYAMDMLPGLAVFSIFRRTSEMPLYRIIKEPELARKQGMWRIVAMNGQIVKRGHKLADVLRYFDRMTMRALED